LAGLDDHVKVIADLRRDVDLPAEPRLDLSQAAVERFPILVVVVEGETVHAPGVDVVRAIRPPRTVRARHRVRLRALRGGVNPLLPPRLRPRPRVRP
jgi:hypothetical protein